MSYAVKEIFYTLQGEGLNAGRPAVFCRFAGCNLWSGREADRDTAACRFCDTDFVGTDGTLGGKYADPTALARRIATCWPVEARDHRFAVLTGGEPLLQVDAPLVDALHAEGFVIAVETNGSIAAPTGIDWVCVSPKAGTALVQQRGDELKLVFPQDGLPPEAVAQLPFRYFLLQPMDGPRVAENTAAAMDYCRTHPQWRLSVQLHKVLGIR